MCLQKHTERYAEAFCGERDLVALAPVTFASERDVWRARWSQRRWEGCYLITSQLCAD